MFLWGWSWVDRFFKEIDKGPFFRGLLEWYLLVGDVFLLNFFSFALLIQQIRLFNSLNNDLGFGKFAFIEKVWEAWIIWLAKGSPVLALNNSFIFFLHPLYSSNIQFHGFVWVLERSFFNLDILDFIFIFSEFGVGFGLIVKMRKDFVIDP